MRRPFGSSAARSRCGMPPSSQQLDQLLKAQSRRVACFLSAEYLEHPAVPFERRPADVQLPALEVCEAVELVDREAGYGQLAPLAVVEAAKVTSLSKRSTSAASFSLSAVESLLNVSSIIDCNHLAIAHIRLAVLHLLA